MAWSIKSIFCCAGLLSSGARHNEAQFYPLSNVSSQESIGTENQHRKKIELIPSILAEEGFRNYQEELKIITNLLVKRSLCTYEDLKEIIDAVIKERSVFYKKALAPDYAHGRVNDMCSIAPDLLEAIAFYAQIVQSSQNKVKKYSDELPKTRTSLV